MDDSGFDALTRAFTSARSRRAALGTLLAATLGLLDLTETHAKTACPTCKKRKHGKCKPNKRLNDQPCPDGSDGTCQDGQCVSSAEPAPEPPRTCPAGACSRNTPCGAGCVCLDIGSGTKRCLALGTCSGAGDCTAGTCGSGCTCVNPGGRKSGCASTADCPPDKGKCTPDNGYCGPNCICVGEAAAARCASVVR